MQFDSLQALWQMGGHGLFVWSAYAIALVTLLALVVVPVQRSRRVLNELRVSEQRRNARAREVSSPSTSV
jgi:heme exporter protein D